MNYSVELIHLARRFPGLKCVQLLCMTLCVFFLICLIIPVLSLSLIEFNLSLQHQRERSQRHHCRQRVQRFIQHCHHHHLRDRSSATVPGNQSQSQHRGQRRGQDGENTGADATAERNLHRVSLFPIPFARPFFFFSQDNADFFYIDVWSSRFTWGGLSPPEKGTFAVITKGQTILLDTNTPVLKMLLIQGDFSPPPPW